jgi:hypothetical protein
VDRIGMKIGWVAPAARLTDVEDRYTPAY